MVGYDVSDEALELARGRAREITNLTFENHPAEAIPTDPPFELITSFDVIHDLADPLAGLTRIREALGPDGQFLMMEPNASTYLENNLDDWSALFYGVSALHCMTQSLGGGRRGSGCGLGPGESRGVCRTSRVLEIRAPGRHRQQFLGLLPAQSVTG